MDRDLTLKKIQDIKKTVKGKCPNVYLLHGDFTDTEINELYNHPKVKAMVSLTKGKVLEDLYLNSLKLKNQS